MSVEENKRVARRYHDLNPDEVEEILTPDFIGHQIGFTWDRERHKQVWSKEEWRAFKDTIREQIAEGEWVATHFTRSGPWEGKHVEGDMMQFKRFEGGKIAELWEIHNPKQFEE